MGCTILDLQVIIFEGSIPMIFYCSGPQSRDVQEVDSNLGRELGGELDRDDVWQRAV